MLKKLFFLIIFACMTSITYGQRPTTVSEMVSQMEAQIARHKTTDVNLVRFVCDVISVGNYQMSGKTYYLNYPNGSDISKLNTWSSYLDKLLKLQGACKTLDKNEADMIVSISFASSKDKQSFNVDMPSSLYSSQNMGSFETFRSSTNQNSTSSTSAANSHLPYQRDSFESAGDGRSRKRHQVKVNRYINYFSLIIEGTSQNGDQLWRTISTDNRSAGVTDAIMPYLCFAALGYLGVDKNDAVQFMSDNPVFEKWVEGYLTPENTFLFPKSSKSNKVEIVAAISEGNTLTVLIRDGVNKKLMKKNEVFMEFDGFRIPAAERYQEDRLDNNHYQAYSVLKFVLESRVPDKFDLNFYDRKGKVNSILSISGVELN